MSGFGLAKVKAEGEIADPNDFDWEHDPLTGGCEKCTNKYYAWKARYDAQEAQKETAKCK